MPKRILHIGRKESETSAGLFAQVSICLKEEGLAARGKLFEGNPSIYGFESKGDGGFFVEYHPDKKTFSDSANTDPTLTDVTIIPNGATESLVHRTFEQLTQKLSEDEGRNFYERGVSGNHLD